MWKSIKTAPKRGTEFLAYCPANPEGEWSGHEEPRFAVCYFSISGHLFEAVGQMGLNDEDAKEDGQRYFNPTHWMPLPKAPEQND